MKLWGGRFTKETDKLVNNFNASISFDQKFYKQDIQGSIAHAKMLGAAGIISEEESTKIQDGLTSILADIESGKLEITDEYEDIHTFMEATLIERIGDAGKKLHTGRSRNDQVALDMRLYTRDEVKNIDDEVKALMEVILRIIKEMYTLTCLDSPIFRKHSLLLLHTILVLTLKCSSVTEADLPTFTRE